MTQVFKISIFYTSGIQSKFTWNIPGKKWITKAQYKNITKIHKDQDGFTKTLTFNNSLKC